MAAYVIIDSEVTDPPVFRRFLETAPAVAEAHGAKYLVRAGAFEVVQGTWAPRRLVVLEFDSMAQAKAWQDAPDYADLKQMLNRCSNTDVVIVEGV